MSKRQANTPKSQIRSALRRLFLRSRERSQALKNAGNCCEECGKKASKAKGREIKVEVHHREHILNWELLFQYVYNHLLCHPDELQVLCEECHKLEHKEGK